jgi:hypothetical protein
VDDGGSDNGGVDRSAEYASNIDFHPVARDGQHIVIDDMEYKIIVRAAKPGFEDRPYLVVVDSNGQTGANPGDDVYLFSALDAKPAGGFDSVPTDFPRPIKVSIDFIDIPSYTGQIAQSYMKIEGTGTANDGSTVDFFLYKATGEHDFSVSYKNTKGLITYEIDERYNYFKVTHGVENDPDFYSPIQNIYENPMTIGLPSTEKIVSFDYFST